MSKHIETPNFFQELDETKTVTAKTSSIGPSSVADSQEIRLHDFDDDAEFKGIPCEELIKKGNGQSNTKKVDTFAKFKARKQSALKKFTKK